MKTKQCFWLKKEKVSLISAFLLAKVLNWLLNYALCILQIPTPFDLSEPNFEVL